jgi:hypothetical protein
VFKLLDYRLARTAAAPAGSHCRGGLIERNIVSHLEDWNPGFCRPVVADFRGAQEVGVGWVIANPPAAHCPRQDALPGIVVVNRPARTENLYTYAPAADTLWEGVYALHGYAPNNNTYGGDPLWHPPSTPRKCVVFVAPFRSPHSRSGAIGGSKRSGYRAFAVVRRFSARAVLTP